MKLLFVHGWGFESSLWKGLARGFADCAFAERGYFGAPAGPQLDGDYLAVTHSFGTMRLLATLPPGCRGIVAINGFDRFAATPGFPGVPPRFVERMIARFGEAPDEVLADFRERCGCDAQFSAIVTDLLLEDLIALRDGDCRSRAAGCDLPILVLQGRCDPILPPAMREAVFAAAGCCVRHTHEAGGHLLPLQDPDYCADAIDAFMKRLT